jgi:hypothetical protein
MIYRHITDAAYRGGCALSTSVALHCWIPLGAAHRRRSTPAPPYLGLALRLKLQKNASDMHEPSLSYSPAKQLFFYDVMYSVNGFLPETAPAPLISPLRFLHSLV